MQDHESKNLLKIKALRIRSLQAEIWLLKIPHDS